MEKKQAQIAFARQFRHKQPEAEGALWSKLRKRQLDGVRFRRQQPIGSYIVDFVSFEKKLVIEIDGGQHNEEEARQRDERRTAWLNERGYRVLRFWDNEVLKNTDGVLAKIKEALC